MNVKQPNKIQHSIEIGSHSSQQFLTLLNKHIRQPNTKPLYFTALIDTNSSLENWLDGLEQLSNKPLQQWLKKHHPANKLGSFRLSHPTLNFTLDLHIGHCETYIKDLSSVYEIIYLDIVHSELLAFIPYIAAHNAQLIINNPKSHNELCKFDELLDKVNFIPHHHEQAHYIYQGQPIKQKFKHWWSTEKNDEKKDVCIIGAGISGACLAFMLQSRGYQVTLLESKNNAALGGSGNYLGMISPYFQAQVNPTSSFYISAYAFALQFFQQFSHCISSQSNTKTLDHKHLKQHKKAVKIHGFNTHQVQINENDTVTYADALNVYPAKLANALLKNIHVVYNTHVEDIHYEQNQWVLNTRSQTRYTTSKLVLANSTLAYKLLKKPLYPVSQRHGQTSVFLKKQVDSRLASQHFGTGYFIEENDRVLIGAARDPQLDMSEDPQCSNQLHRQNKINLVGAIPHFANQLGDLLDGHAAVRAMSPDRLPLVGRVDQYNKSGLYLCTGMGARGLTIAPYCAEHITNLIANQAPNATETVIKAIHPHRFEQRAKAKKT